MNDIGIVVNHFAKDEVTLLDLFVWPELSKATYHIDKKATEKIRNDILTELRKNQINLITGSLSIGKTSLAKMLFVTYASEDSCCLFMNGLDFKTIDMRKTVEIIEHTFSSQYSETRLEAFRKLPKSKRIVVVDDFDYSKLHGDRRNLILDFLTDFFGTVYIFLSSDIELPSIMTSKSISSMQTVFTYDILPLGNRKRKELISKWYYLHERNREEDEIDKRIEKGIAQVNMFLGNGASFIPAVPVSIIGVLQNSDAITPTYNGSQYGFLYETMIQKSLSAVAPDYTSSGQYNIDIVLISRLAFSILQNGKTFFSDEEIACIIDGYRTDKKLELSKDELLKRMCEARIFYQDSGKGVQYRFKYPYIFYYFAGRHIAYNFNDDAVKKAIEHMSSRLYIEDYGNIMIFVCHFANNLSIIEEILLNAYATLEKYDPFDFTKSSSIFHDMKEAVEALKPKMIGSNADVPDNKERSLSRLDEAGINDGHVHESEDKIDEDISNKEKDMAAISAALKTLDVLGQILQNYPGDIDGHLKVEVIDEIYKLGMRSVQAIIESMGFLEQDLIAFIIDRTEKESKNYRRDDVAAVARKFIDMLISGMVRGMINKVAITLNSKHLLPAAKEVFEKERTYASKLVLMELKINCLKIPDYVEISNLKGELDRANERFASCILSNIIAYYLNYNTCDYRLRSRLCMLFGFSEKHTLAKNQFNLLEQGT